MGGGGVNITYHLRNGQTAEIVNVHRYDVRDGVEGVTARHPGGVTLKGRDGNTLAFDFTDVTRIVIDLEA